MGAMYTPSPIPYDLNTWLDNQGAYTLNEGVDTLLDISRMLTDYEDSYYWLAIPFPDSVNVFMNPLQTFSGVVQVPSLAYLYAITGDSLTQEGGHNVTGANQGFKFRIYDKGGKLDSFVTTQFALKSSVAPSLRVDPTYNNAGDPFGPYLLQSPMVVLEPGQLQMELTNLNNTSNFQQVLLHLAIPCNRQSANEMMIGTSGH